MGFLGIMSRKLIDRAPSLREKLRGKAWVVGGKGKSL